MTSVSRLVVVLTNGSCKVLMLYKADILTILIIFDTNLVKEILDRHEDDSMLVRLLQTHFSLFLVADHQLCLISLNIL